MRRLMSIGTAVILTLSVTACANRNTTLNDNRTPNVGINRATPIPQQITRRYTAPNSTEIGRYNDGVYRGEGNKTNVGNEIAIVTIRNGLIDNIELSSVDANGNPRNFRATGTTAHDIDTNIDNYGASINAPGTNIGTGNANAGGAGTGVGTRTGAITGTGVGTRTGVDTRIDDRTNNIGDNNIVDNRIGAGTAVDQAKARLINNIIQSQNPDVNIESDANLTATVNNWKAAVKNALNKASRS